MISAAISLAASAEPNTFGKVETTNENPPAPLPAPPARLRWSRADTETALLVLILKALVLGVAVLSVGTLFDQTGTWQTLWNRWDATHYLKLAENGYTAKGEGRYSIVFYPLYPWLVRAVAFVCRNYFWAALLVSGVASICAGLLFRRVAELDQPAKVARLAVWFLFIFPTAYFLHIGYSESLFLALILGCLLAARMQVWAVAGVAWRARLPDARERALAHPDFDGGGLAAISSGAPFRLALALDRGCWPGLRRLPPPQLSRHRRSPRLYPDHGETVVQKIAPPWLGIRDVWLRIPNFNLTEGLHEFIFIVFSFLCTVWCWLKLRPTYAVWMTLNWLLINSTTYVVSVPRYCLTLFPIFILLALIAARRPLVGQIMSALSLLLLALFAMKFAHGTWAF